MISDVNLWTLTYPESNGLDDKWPLLIDNVLHGELVGVIVRCILFTRPVSVDWNGWGYNKGFGWGILALTRCCEYCILLIVPYDPDILVGVVDLCLKRSYSYCNARCSSSSDRTVYFLKYIQLENSKI